MNERYQQFIFIETYDKEDCTQTDRLHFDIEIERETNTEMIWIREHFTRQPRPLFRYFTHICTIDG